MSEVSVCDSLAFLLAAHLQVDVLNVGGRLWSSAAMTATYSVASLALMKGCIASLTSYCC